MPRNSNGPIDPENPYRRKSVQRQMDNDPRTSREAFYNYITPEEFERDGYRRGVHFKDGTSSTPYGISYDFDVFDMPNGKKIMPYFPGSRTYDNQKHYQYVALKPVPTRGSAVMKSMLKSDMCKCGSGMMKSMCKCGGMNKSMYKAKSTGPIDPDNPYRRKSVQRQMDNDPETSRNARNSYASLDAIERELSGWQKEAFPNTRMKINFDTIGNPKTGFLIPTGKGAKGDMYISSSSVPLQPFSSRGGAARKRMYKADDKIKNTDWASKLSGAAVDFVLRNKSVIERKAKELSDQGFNYVNQHKSDIGRGAKNLTENGIDFLSANKSNIERGAKNVSDMGFDYVRRNKPNIEGVDYILDNKSNIERGAKDISDKAFDYARRNKSGIGQAAERMTNQAVDYAIRSKPAIEREAKRYSDQGFDYLRRSKNEIGRQARGLVSNVLGATTTKRAGAMSKSLQSNKKKNKYF